MGRSKEEADSPSSLSSSDRSKRAVDLVYKAFNDQHDVEVAARVTRKNLQVMDRLAKMSTHKEVRVALYRGQSDKALRIFTGRDLTS